MTVVAQNIGTATWRNTGANPIRLGTSNSKDRTSSFCGAGWISCTRPALLTQGEVKPGQLGTFGFWATAPSQSGTYYENFNLVAEGATWFNDPGLYFPIVVVDSYKWNATSLNFYRDASHTQPISNGELLKNTKYYVHMVVQNKGNVTWNNTSQNPIRLAPSNPKDYNSIMCAPEWINCKRVVRMNETSVAPNGTASFDFTIKTTKDSQYISQQLALLQEGIRWFDTYYTAWTKSNEPSYTWAYSEMKFFTDNTKSQQVDPSNLTKGQRVYLQLTVKNTGNTTWLNNGANPIRIGTFGPRDRASKYYDTTWIAGNRLAVVKQVSTPPGGTATFETWLKAPASTGSYGEYFNLLAENQAWMKDLGLNIKLTVH